MIINGQVGPQSSTSSLAAGTQPAMRLGNMGEQIVSELHGKYYETCYRRAVYTASALAVSLPTTLNTTSTGLCLYNPVGSPVNLVILTASWGLNVVPTAAAVLSLATGYSATAITTSSAADTLKSAFVGVGGSGVGVAYKSVTLPSAATHHTILGSVGTAATTAWPVIPIQTYNVDGQIILPPGAYCVFNSTAAQTSTQFYLSFSWEEVPV